MQANVVVEGEGVERTPVIGGATMPVAELVHTAHEQGVAVALQRWASLGQQRERLEATLTYCAERRCEADDATCPGCKLRNAKLGIASLDEFVDRHTEIRFKASPIRLRGSGAKSLTADNLEALAQSWSGEEYWFWARRVIRKLRHGLRRAHLTGKPATSGASPAIILVEPQLADNIGMVARAMANFGLDTLRLVAPRDGWPNEKARIAASGANYVVDEAEAYPSLASAIADLNWIVATTARQRDLKKPVLTPEQAVAEMRSRVAIGQRCGILFGRERNGLETSEIANADAIVMIPVNSRFASLNLAQAVLLLGYEWMKPSPAATLGRVTTYETPQQAGLNLRDAVPATKEELVGFFEHLEAELDRSGFFNPPEKRPSMVNSMRTMFTRMGATEQEIRTLRGIVKALVYPRRSARKLP